MLALVRAELLKAIKHHKLMSFLVWIFPVGYAAFYVVVIPLTLVSDGARETILASCPGDWPTSATSVWGILTSFPGSVFGKMLPLAFMVVMFAGEYEWGTWKNVIPRARRSRLIIAKLIALTLIVLISFIALSAVPVIGQNLGCLLIGADAGPALSVESLSRFVEGYAQNAFLGWIVMVFMAVFAAISALLTRSILGGLLLSLGISIVDIMSLGFLSLLGRLLCIPALIDLYIITPSYNIENLRSWFQTNQALQSVTPSSPLLNFQSSFAVSLAILALWLVGLVLLALRMFQRQDITS